MSVASVNPSTPVTVADSLRNVKPRSMWEDAWRRLIRGRNGQIGIIIVVLILMIAVGAPLIDNYDPTTDSNMEASNTPPNAQHLFGTDRLGRDVFRRVMHGTRYSLVVALISIVVGNVLSTGVGMVSGYYGGAADTVILRIMELMQAFPGIPLAIAIVAILGPGLTSTILAITVVGIPGSMRVSRALTLSLKNLDYVEAARSLGASNLHLLIRHILPNLISFVIVGATLGVGGIILQAAALGFLGLGAQPPAPEWGVMIADAVPFLRQFPHLALFPGLAIMVTVLGFNLLGDGLRDALDPSLSGRA
ncbi:MAG TPA: ABC transporter permease [Anaerolineae bacterium]|jgi:ABC-type dipeptide/oligopeptide/nickel transport system permease subunit